MPFNSVFYELNLAELLAFLWDPVEFLQGIVFLLTEALSGLHLKKSSIFNLDPPFSI